MELRGELNDTGLAAFSGGAGGSVTLHLYKRPFVYKLMLLTVGIKSDITEMT